MSKKQIYYQRHISGEIERLSAYYPVIVITGPRQSGKTTLCRKQFPDFHYANMENLSLREQVLTSPEAFITQYHKGLIIDEVQNVPELLSYIQVVADEKKDSHIILTGSNNFALLQSITQSLAGRASVLTLLPLSLSEIGNLHQKSTDLLILNGGYPAIWGEHIPAGDVCQNYYNTYVERDIRQMLKIKNLIQFQTFIKLCAGRTGSVFNASALSGEVGVSVPTIQEWLSVLEASYILFRLPPFFRSIGKRLIKTPKIYFYDTALLCYLLGIENEKHLEMHPLRGSIFENMVVLEFFKNAFNRGKMPRFYFYRDQSQKEVDLIEEKGMDLFAYEIKSAKSFTKSFLSNLNYIKRVAGDDVKLTQLIYDGKEGIKSTHNGIINFRELQSLLHKR